MSNYSGSVIRPSTGRAVTWTLAPVLASIGRDLDRMGITWYSIGDHAHLLRNGGHTPWKPGAPLGMVTAIDVMKSPYSDVEARYLLVAKSRFDTSFVDFANTNYHQYDFDGSYQGPSGDGHWHLETLGSRTGGSSTMIRQMWPERFSTSPPPAPAQADTTHLGDPMSFQLVKLRSNDAVLKAEAGTLQWLTPKQFSAAQGYILAHLPATASAADKQRAIVPFVVEDEEALTFFGDVVEGQVKKVNGLDVITPKG